MTKKTKIIAIAAVTLLMTPIAVPQIKQIIKVIGVGAAVKQFNKDINKAFNKLANRSDTATKMTKVVPILTVGIGKSNAIGAAQVMGPPSLVKRVNAVAAPETELFGKEIRIRALIPVEDMDVSKGIDTVDGVGVSGIVDLKL
ncbi:MAG: hypothetical protein JNJ45_09840 [Chthonomonas sp.]|nr:hypothetical protein [Chthonomonas sp.]